LTQEVVDRVAAGGFLRTTPDPTNGVGRRFLHDRLNVISDEIEVLTSSVMGLTIRRPNRQLRTGGAHAVGGEQRSRFVE
jgi:hypothetical protein